MATMGKPQPTNPEPHPPIERRGLIVNVDGLPTWHLEPWIATRLQDWTPSQADMIWPEARR